MENNPTKIFFIRHGVTDQTGKILYGHNRGIFLNDKGVNQAKLTAEYLSEVKIDAIYSSPLERAIGTAEELAKLQNLEVQAIDELIDTDCGVLTGKTLEECAKMDDWEIITKSPSSYTFQGGESFKDLFVRMNKAVNEIVALNQGKNVAVVCHRDPIIILMAHYLGLDMNQFQKIPCAPASITIVNFMKEKADIQSIGVLPPNRIEE